MGTVQNSSYCDRTLSMAMLADIFPASMVTERYAHILDDNRRVNAKRFQQQFYSSPVSEEPAKQPDPIQEFDAGGKEARLLKLLTESLEMAFMIKSLAQAM